MGKKIRRLNEITTWKHVVAAHTVNVGRFYFSFLLDHSLCLPDSVKSFQRNNLATYLKM